MNLQTDPSKLSLTMQEGLGLISERAAENLSLAVLVTSAQHTTDPQVSVVNAAVITHPVTKQGVVALVARPGVKLTNLRRHPRATLVLRAGWEWVAVRGDVELSGPDDANAPIPEEPQRQLLRTIYLAAGGEHPDMDGYDQAMLAERRCAVLVNPERIWSNPPGAAHQEPGDLT